jgi:hypothetical protein
MTQTLLALLLVACCSLYALWSLMPSSLRRALARSLTLSQLPLPGFIARRLLRVATSSPGCGGCSHTPVQHRTGTGGGCH